MQVRSRLVRIHAQSGEFVRQGQEVVGLVDCTRPLVAAEVSDRIFRSLHLGMRGTFNAADGGLREQGEIVELRSPLTGGQPGDAGQYRVVLQVNHPALAQECPTGLAGRVSF